MNPDFEIIISRVDRFLEEEKFDFSERRIVEPKFEFDRDDIFNHHDKMIDARHLDKPFFERDFYEREIAGREDFTFNREDIFNQEIERFIPTDDGFMLA